MGSVYRVSGGIGAPPVDGEHAQNLGVVDQGEQLSAVAPVPHGRLLV